MIGTGGGCWGISIRDAYARRASTVAGDKIRLNVRLLPCRSTDMA